MVSTEELRERGARADALHAEARRILVDAARASARAGMSQRAIGTALGRSQPEVARLVRFRGSTARGRSLAARRREVLEVLGAAGGRNPRVFGSVARGDDDDESDIDLLVDFVRAPSLFELARLERALGELLGSTVDIVPADRITAPAASGAMRDAVAL